MKIACLRLKEKLKNEEFVTFERLIHLEMTNLHLLFHDKLSSFLLDFPSVFRLNHLSKGFLSTHSDF